MRLGPIISLSIVSLFALPACAQVTGVQETLITCPQSVETGVLQAALPQGWSAYQTASAKYTSLFVGSGGAVAGNLICVYGAGQQTYSISAPPPTGMACTANATQFVCRKTSPISTRVGGH